MTPEANPTESPRQPFAVVVNDDRFQLRVLQEHVRKGDLEAVPFQSAQAALDYLSNVAAGGGQLPAVVITDLYMPGLDGWRFCRLLRSPEFAALNAIPILVVSATFAGDEPARIAADLGAEGFLEVPIDRSRFQEHLRAVLTGGLVRSPLWVLVVDDSISIAALVRKTMEAHGHRVETVCTVREAIDAASTRSFDAAIIDYHLPDGTGDTVLDAIREASVDTVCIMITTDTTPSLALDWMMRGATATVRKPFEPEYLVELCARGRRERALLRVQDLLEERTRALRESEQNYKTLLRELHHRVKNNLNVVSGLLSLQSSMIRDPEQAIAAFQTARDRVAAMSLVHEELYKSLTFSRIAMKQYTETLVHHIARSHGMGGRVVVEVDADAIEISVDIAVPCGLILNELVTNAFKYAFPNNREGRIVVSLVRCAAPVGVGGGNAPSPSVETKNGDSEYVELTVRDDGVGFPIERAGGDSLGLTLVDLLARQINGTVAHIQDEGTRFRVRFPCETIQS
ncbi:MAG: response regulator [Spirochaetaceae bacterium]|nr:MAG: response regulator [Spirochaetaceae bacterium]